MLNRSVVAIRPKKPFVGWLGRIGCAVLLCVWPSLSFAEGTGGEGGFLLKKNGDGPGCTAWFHDDEAFEHVYVSTDATRKDFIPLGQLQEHSNVEDVFYSYGEVVNANDFLELARVKSLRSLTIGFTGCIGEWATVEGDFLKLGALKQIDTVSLNVDPIKDDDLRFVAALPRLTCFEICAGGPDPGVLRAGPGCTDLCAEHLSKAANLESLLIHDGWSLSDQFVDRLTAGTKKLKRLDLDSGLLTDESLRLLAERCPQLEHLNLGSDRLTDAGVRHLHRLKNLRSLSLSSAISADSVAEIPTLREVALTGCRVRDQGAVALANLRPLERLVLYGPQLTDEQFSRFRDHPSLKHLILDGKRLTSDATLPVLESVPSIEDVTFLNNEILQRAANRVLKQRAVQP